MLTDILNVYNLLTLLDKTFRNISYRLAIIKKYFENLPYSNLFEFQLGFDKVQRTRDASQINGVVFCLSFVNVGFLHRWFGLTPARLRHEARSRGATG